MHVMLSAKLRYLIFTASFCLMALVSVYQSDFGDNTTDILDAEKWLLNFYVALDNGHLNEALEAISAIIAQVTPDANKDVSLVAELSFILVT